MSEHYVLEERDGERWLVVTGTWSREVVEALRAGLWDRLELNYARGFSAESLELLGEVPGLRALRVLDRTVVDLDPIYELADTLEVLSIQASPSAELDLGQLPKIREIAGEWDLIGPTLARSLGLQAVRTWRYGAPDLRDFRDHVELERLSVKDAPTLTSLSGIADLPSLLSLHALGVPKLDDIDDVAALGHSLREFELERCHRIEQIEAVESLIKLRFLGLNDAGTIPTLAPLRDLHGLQVIHAWGTTKILDGDLSPLSVLPNLRELRMRERRSYRPTVRELQAAIGWQP